jgi:protein arginine kinase activator
MDEKKMCSVCKTKPATVFFTNVSSENKFVNLNLCDDCAKAKGFNDPTSFAMADLMLGLGAAQEIEQAVGLELKCPRCGFSQADFKKSGRLGCPECYRTFAEGLNGLLKTMHKGTRHVGKSPEALRQTRENVDRLKSLQKKLAKAIGEEDYETAAALRDEIKTMTGAVAAKTTR